MSVFSVTLFRLASNYLKLVALDAMQRAERFFIAFMPTKTRAIYRGRRANMAKEIERKFLVNNDAWRALAKGTMYRQGYLNSAKERTVRIRTADEKAFLTIKGITVGAARTEYEYEIPFDEGKAVAISPWPKSSLAISWSTSSTMVLLTNSIASSGFLRIRASTGKTCTMKANLRS